MKPPIVNKSPTNWFLFSNRPQDYAVGTDNIAASYDKSSGFIYSTNADAVEFGTLMQTSKADKYKDKRLKMSANIKTENVKRWAGLWLRVDGKEDKVLAFDNMADRPIRGTTDWKRYEIVVDVPEDAENLAFGILLERTGKTWISDISFEVVDKIIPLTNPNKIYTFQFQERPMNLDFKS
jgi:hypothetical protein